jgi:hypothetical protein
MAASGEVLGGDTREIGDVSVNTAYPCPTAAAKRSGSDLPAEARFERTTRVDAR